MTDLAFMLEGITDHLDTLVARNFQRGPALVNLWAPSAGPSLRQGELLRRLADEYHGRLLLVNVDTDAQKTPVQVHRLQGRAVL